VHVSGSRAPGDGRGKEDGHECRDRNCHDRSCSRLDPDRTPKPRGRTAEISTFRSSAGPLSAGHPVVSRSWRGSPDFGFAHRIGRRSLAERRPGVLPFSYLAIVLPLSGMRCLVCSEALDDNVRRNFGKLTRFLATRNDPLLDRLLSGGHPHCRAAPICPPHPIGTRRTIERRIAL